MKRKTLWDFLFVTLPFAMTCSFFALVWMTNGTKLSINEKPLPAKAPTKWDPGILVNTESVSPIDEGDPELRFGESLIEKMHWQYPESGKPVPDALKGYPDGTFRGDDSPNRANLIRGPGGKIIAVPEER